MIYKFKDLNWTNRQKKAFTKEFNALHRPDPWNDLLSVPWCSPWKWGGECEAPEGASVATLAAALYAQYRDEIEGTAPEKAEARFTKWQEEQEAALLEYAAQQEKLIREYLEQQREIAIDPII